MKDLKLDSCLYQKNQLYNKDRLIFQSDNREINYKRQSLKQGKKKKKKEKKQRVVGWVKTTATIPLEGQPKLPNSKPGRGVDNSVPVIT